MNPESKWVQVTACENIPLREGRAATIRGRQIAVFRLGERFLAVENRCPHRGGPLAEGMISGTSAVCPLHAWKVDLETGGVVHSPGASGLEACVKTFTTRVVDGILEIEVRATHVEEKHVVENCVYPDRPIRWVQRKAGISAATAAEVL